MEKLNGKWKGKFSFDNPEHEYEKLEHHFDMNIVVEDDDVTGEIVDITENDHFPGIAKIEGFIDEDEISFIKQYPFLHLKNEQNETIIDKNRPHPEIHYHGIIKDDMISGTWEMEAGVVLRAGQYLTKMVLGTWEIRKG